jgi:predicted transcriptional regulator
MRQPEVSKALNYMMEQGWITSRETSSENKGRPKKVYKLAKPITEIMDCIDKETENKAHHKLALIKKLRDYLH